MLNHLPRTTGRSLAAFLVYSLILLSTRSVAQTNLPTSPTEGLIGSKIGTSRVLCTGDVIFLYTSLDGYVVPAGTTFQWQRNGVDMDGATNSSFVTQQSGTYAVRVQQGNRSASSQPLVVEAVSTLPKPVLSISPRGYAYEQGIGRDLCDGSRYIVSTQYGTYPYQWFRNGQPIPGGSSIDFLAKESGTYTLQLKTGVCSIMSDPIRFDVEPTKGKLPIEISDQTRGACPGSFRRLDVRYFTTDRYEIEWYKSGQFIPGAVGTTYIPPTDGEYAVKVTRKDNSCSNTSEPVRVQSAESIKLALDHKTGDQTICAGTNYSMQIDYDNTGSFYLFQWLKDGQPIAGATGYSYRANQAGRYQVRVRSGQSCETVSEAVNLRVTDIGQPAVLQKSSPTCAGTVALSVEQPTDGTTYTWRRNSRTQYGSTGPALNPTTSGLYAVVAQKDGCATESVGVNVTADAPIVAPTLTPGGYSPVAPLVSCQKDVTIGYTPKTGQTYQWQKDGIGINFAESKLTLSRFDQSGTYTLLTTENKCVVSQSVSVVLYDVNFKPQLKTTGPSFLCAGQSVKLALRNPYDGSRVKWLRDGLDLPGATNAELTVTEPGRYFALLSLPCNYNYPSEEFIVKRSQLGRIPLSAFYTSGFDNGAFCPDKPVTLEVNTQTGQRYQWLRDGQPLPGDTLNQLKPLASGSYSMRVTDEGGCQAVSGATQLTRYEPAIATLSGSTAIAFDSTAYLTIQLTGQPPFDVRLSDGTAFSAVSGNVIRYPVRLQRSTVFTVAEVRNRCGPGTATGTADVRVIILAAESDTDRRLKVSPIPASSVCTVTIDLPTAGPATVSLVNSGGQTVLSTRSSQRVRTHEFPLDVSALPAGLYIVRVQAGERVYVRKLLKL